MDAKLLIDAIVRQTTVLIAQLSTAAGIRAPLAHVADQVFLDFASEIEAQGVGRKVFADMFGLALRSYQKKVQRLTESATVRERTLWEAVLDFLSHEGSATRERIFERFRRDSEHDVAAVLLDLVGQGLVYSTGKGKTAVYGASSEADRGRVVEHGRHETLVAMVWLALYRRASTRDELLCEPFFAAGCQTPIYFGCNPGDPICVNGACENWGGGLGNGTNPDGGITTCEERTQQLGHRVRAHADRADRTCAADADCTFIYLDFRCYHACDSGPLSTAGASALMVELGALGTEFCPAFEAAGCRMDVPPCVPFTSMDGAPPVRCVANVCEYVKP